MSTNPFLSIIIPVYNTKSYLPSCLDSILAQEWTDYEIILVDDGSTDGSSALCDEYAARHEHIRCHHQPNKGLVATRQQGFILSRGQYITFVDSDDWIASDMYTCMCRKAQETYADILCCNYIAVMPTREKKCCAPFPSGLYNKERLISEVYPFMLYSGTFFVYGVSPNLWNKIFRRTLLEKHLLRVPHNVKVGEDALASYSCMLEASSIYFFDEAFYFYRSNANSLTRYTMNQTRLSENHTLFETLSHIIDIVEYPYVEQQLNYYFVYQTLLTFTPVFHQMSEDGVNFRQIFLDECAYPHIRKAFAAIRNNNITGIHNKFYAFCIRHRLYLLFKLLLKY